MRSFSTIALAGLAAASPVVVDRAAAPPAAGLENVTPDFFTTLSRYATYSSAAQPSPCKVPPFGSTVLAYLNEPTTDTQATLFRDDARKELIISYRGSSSLQDFLTDFTFIPVPYKGCPDCAAHVGFYSAWRSIQNASQTAIDAGQKANPSYALVVVGHSLGGALSQLAWAGLKDAGYTVHEGWSYGQPRVGNPAYADFIDNLAGATDAHTGSFYRITHDNDGVPGLPLTLMGFQHSRTEFWAKNEADGVAYSNSTYRCPGQENAHCNAGAGGFFINEAHVNYPGINYGTVCT